MGGGPAGGFGWEQTCIPSRGSPVSSPRLIQLWWWELIQTDLRSPGNTQSLRQNSDFCIKFCIGTSVFSPLFAASCRNDITKGYCSLPFFQKHCHLAFKKWHCAKILASLSVSKLYFFFSVNWKPAPPTRGGRCWETQDWLQGCWKLSHSCFTSQMNKTSRVASC